MKLINLTRGKIAIVDDEDFEFLDQWKWCVDGKGYAVRHQSKSEYKNGIRKMVKMHTIINKTPTGSQTDHINRNRLDNRKENLRTVNASQNQHNTKVSSVNTSGFKGVYWDKKYKRWCARAWFMGKSIFGGGFKNKLEAVKSYDNLMGGVF